MLYGPRLALVHPPRTGGVFLGHALQAERLGRADIGPEKRIGRHAGIGDYNPKHLEGRALMCTIRNPWRHLLALYLYTKPRRKGRGPTGWAGIFYRRAGATTFDQFVRCATQFHTVPGLVDIPMVWPLKGSKPFRCGDVAALGIDLCSFMVLRIASLQREEVLAGDVSFSEGLFADCAFVDTAKLSVAVPTALRALGVPFKSGLVNRIGRRPPRNAAGKLGSYGYGDRDPWDYYTPETRELVAKSAKATIDRMGYRFGVDAATRPVSLPTQSG